MKKKALYSYAGLILIVFLMRIYPARLLEYLLPAYLVCVPVFLAGEIHFSFSLKHLMSGLIVSICILVPFYLLFHPLKNSEPLTLNVVLIQLVAVSFAEEVYFRGFLQQVLGNNIRGVAIISAMFMLTHIPAFIFSGDRYALLTFFPSLVMGGLYLKTSNVLPSTVFHFLSNMVFLGFMI